MARRSTGLTDEELRMTDADMQKKYDLAWFELGQEKLALADNAAARLSLSVGAGPGRPATIGSAAGGLDDKHRVDYDAMKSRHRQELSEFRMNCARELSDIRLKARAVTAGETGSARADLGLEYNDIRSRISAAQKKLTAVERLIELRRIREARIKAEEDLTASIKAEGAAKAIADRKIRLAERAARTTPATPRAIVEVEVDDDVE